MSYPPMRAPQVTARAPIGAIPSNPQRVTRLKVKSVANLKRHPVKVAKRRIPCLLEYRKSFVTQAQLDDPRTHFYIPLAISIRALGEGKLLWQAYKELDEILFPVMVLECGVRLSLASFMRRVLSDFLLHPL